MARDSGQWGRDRRLNGIDRAASSCYNRLDYGGVNMMWRIWLLCLSSVAIGVASAKAQVRTVEGWRISEMDRGCSMSMFYEGGTFFSVIYEPQMTRVRLALSNDTFKSVVAGKDYPISVTLIRPTKLDDDWGSNTFSGYGSDDVHGVIGNYDDEMLIDLAASKGVIFEHADVVVAQLSLKGSSRGIEALRACAAKVARKRPVDPFDDGGAPPAGGTDQTRSVQPLTSPMAWVTNDDYPFAARSARAQGTVKVRLDVDATGRVSNCAVITSSGNATLDDTTCALVVRRARFSPAVGADGQPASSSFETSMAWSLK